MGGKALLRSGIITRRISSEEFYGISREVQNSLSAVGIDSHAVRSYHSKTDFGDIDILVKSNHRINLRDFVRDKFLPEGIVVNGGIVSFDCKGVQVDLIPVSIEDWEISRYFYDYDPFGNLTGKIANTLGLKFGHFGLAYFCRLQTITEKIIVSKDPEKIFAFLGYGLSRYHLGFKTLQEIYDFVISSRYFSVECFLPENINAINRRRNQRRPNYAEFLTYVEKKGVQSKIPYSKDKSQYFDLIAQFFPEAQLEEKLEKLKEKERLHLLASEKFNGHLVMQWTGLQGKELGRCLYTFRSQFSDFQEWVLSKTKEEIKECFMNWYKSEICPTS